MNTKPRDVGGFRSTIAALLFSLVPLPLVADQPAPLPEAREFLEYYVGVWDTRTTVFDDDGSVRLETNGRFEEEVLLDGRRNLHTFYSPDGTQNKAFRFYSPTDRLFYLVDVTWDGALWVLSSPDDEGPMVSAPRTLSDGRVVRIRFTHTDVEQDAFVATMDVSHDDGESWSKRSRHENRRVAQEEKGVVDQPKNESFEGMKRYLAGGSGRWRAELERYDATNPRSLQALGLWFEQSAGGRLLELTVVGHTVDGQVRTAARGFWFLNPESGSVIYQEISPDGAIRHGTTEFPNDTTFVTLTTAVGSDGQVEMNRGENVMLSDSTHWTAAFLLGEDGEWVQQRAISWHREPPPGRR